MARLHVCIAGSAGGAGPPIPQALEQPALEQAFGAFGRLRDVWLAPSNFAFVEFADLRDGASAVAGLNGTAVHGCTLSVTLSTQLSGSDRRQVVLIASLRILSI